MSNEKQCHTDGLVEDVNKFLRELKPGPENAGIITFRTVKITIRKYERITYEHNISKSPFLVDFMHLTDDLEERGRLHCANPYIAPLVKWNKHINLTGKAINSLMKKMRFFYKNKDLTSNQQIEVLRGVDKMTKNKYKKYKVIVTCPVAMLYLEDKYNTYRREYATH